MNKRIEDKQKSVLKSVLNSLQFTVYSVLISILFLLFWFLTESSVFNIRLFI